MIDAWFRTSLPLCTKEIGSFEKFTPTLSAFSILLFFLLALYRFDAFDFCHVLSICPLISGVPVSSRLCLCCIFSLLVLCFKRGRVNGKFKVVSLIDSTLLWCVIHLLLWRWHVRLLTYTVHHASFCILSWTYRRLDLF